MAARRFVGSCLCLFLMTGCINPKEKFGRTWYIDGAGNFGFGVLAVPVGLEEAGYKGQVSNHPWSIIPFNPVLDQTFRFVARGSGQGLGHEITAYLKRHPKADANIIALSAGTGVGVWAIENIEPPNKVKNFILLGSSLSSKYDMTKALQNMKGNVYVYYSPTDPILQGPVRVLGTIDGTYDDSAGLVGLHGAGYETGRIINIGWKPKYVKLGWTGGHADCVNHKFVADELQKWIVPPKVVSKTHVQHAQEDPSWPKQLDSLLVTLRDVLRDRVLGRFTRLTRGPSEHSHDRQITPIALSEVLPSE